MTPNFQIGNILKQSPSAIAIGKFGVFHKGHEGILIKLMDYAKRNKLVQDYPTKKNNKIQNQMRELINPIKNITKI